MDDTYTAPQVLLIFGELWHGGPRVGEVIVSANNGPAIASSKAFARKRIAECRRKGADYPDAKVRVLTEAECWS